MAAVLKRAASVMLAVALTACTGPSGEPGAGPALPGVALPDNAVDNAVARIDGIVGELMSSSGIPGMAVAVLSFPID